MPTAFRITPDDGYGPGQTHCTFPIEVAASQVRSRVAKDIQQLTAAARGERSDSRVERSGMARSARFRAATVRKFASRIRQFDRLRQ
jgi:hypothetical protein